ncbi:MAG: DUF4124 domain-containing protein [Rhodocyclaceae bacterium]
MISKRIVIAAVTIAAVGPVWADIYKCEDESGHVTYTNQKSSGKGCKVLSRDQSVTTVPGSGASSSPKAAAKQPTPSSFPRVDNNTQKQRDNDRRSILEKELSTETQNLEKAKKELSEQEAVRGGDEKNYQRVVDRLQPYKDKVALHERNIAALQKEIANLR